MAWVDPENQRCLRIHDKGSGLSKDKLQNAWLVVGTPDKEENPLSSRKNRVSRSRRTGANPNL